MTGSRSVEIDSRCVLTTESALSIAAAPRATIGPPSLLSYHALADALRCSECGTDVATRQCTTCSFLLCLACATRCDWDGSAGSQSVLSAAHRHLRACKPACAIVGEATAPHIDDIYELEELGIPYLCKPICLKCTPLLLELCPSHMNTCIKECSGCRKSYCTGGLSNATHIYDFFPLIDFCLGCYRDTCINQSSTPACEAAAGFTLSCCSDCSMTACSVCTAGFTLACPSCKTVAGFHIH